MTVMCKVVTDDGKYHPMAMAEYTRRVHLPSYGRTANHYVILRSTTALTDDTAAAAHSTQSSPNQPSPITATHHHSPLYLPPSYTDLLFSFTRSSLNMLHTRTRLQYSLCICSAQGTGRPTGPQCSAVQCSAVSCCCVVVSSSQSVDDWELMVWSPKVIAAVVIVCPTLAADTVSASSLSAQPAGSPASQPASLAAG
jgi:hypothetical protein